MSDRFTDEEREAIEHAIAKGRVRRIEQGQFADTNRRALRASPFHFRTSAARRRASEPEPR